jgi:hypothetical protein
MTNWQYPANWGNPRKPRLRRALSNNAVVAGVISAIVAGVISLLITHYQDQDAAAQQHSSEQTSTVLQLETAATAFFQGTTNLVADCMTTDPNLCPDGAYDAPYVTYTATFNTDRANVPDPLADNLATQMENDANSYIDGIGTPANGDYGVAMFTAYQQLIARCGQLIQGQA